MTDPYGFELRIKCRRCGEVMSAAIPDEEPQEARFAMDGMTSILAGHSASKCSKRMIDVARAGVGRVVENTP